MPQPDPGVRVALPVSEDYPDDIAAYFAKCDVTGFFNYTNRMAHGLDMMPNPEYHTMDR